MKRTKYKLGCVNVVTDEKEIIHCEKELTKTQADLTIKQLTKYPYIFYKIPVEN